MEGAGVTVHIISTQQEKVKGWKDGNWSIELPVTIPLSKARSEDYDALIIPGGVINSDLPAFNKKISEELQQGVHIIPTLTNSFPKPGNIHHISFGKRACLLA